MTGVELDYAVPCADVADHVTLFYLFRADLPVFEDVERADHAQFRLRLSPGGATYSFIDGVAQAAPDFHVIGPTSGAVRVRAQGPVWVFGCGITPAGWAALIGSEASSALNRVLDAGALFGQARLNAAANAMRRAPDNAARFAIGSQLIQTLAAHDGGDACHFMRQVDGWLAASPSPDIADLVAATGLSRRQVERKCNALYGAPPKLLARKYRALRAAVALCTDGECMGDAVGRGFYDQSHLIREVKEFTGLTPGQIRDEPGLLARLTISQRTALGGVVSPLISDT